MSNEDMSGLDKAFDVVEDTAEVKSASAANTLITMIEYFLYFFIYLSSYLPV